MADFIKESDTVIMKKKTVWMLALWCVWLSWPMTVLAAQVNHQALSHDALLASDALIVDIREPHEWKETGVVANAERVTANEHFIERVSALHTPGQPIVLICRTGSRTQQIAGYVADHFDVEVVNLLGGTLRLLEEGAQLNY